MEETGVLILSLKEYPEEKRQFGDIYFTIEKNFQTIQCITKMQDLQEAADFFTFVGFELRSINRFTMPITEKESDMIIAQAKTHAQEKKQELMRKVEEEVEKERKVYEDVQLQSAKKIIERVLEKVTLSLKRSEGILPAIESKKVTALVDELKKLRMGNNFEKIRETIQELFKIIEKIDDEYFVRIQDANATISTESLVTTTDVDKECERMENIKILKSLGAKISLKNQDYASFGPGAIYRKFLQKDILFKCMDFTGVLRSSYDIIELIMLVVVSLLGVYTLANEIYIFSVNQFGLSYMLMSVGLRGMVIFAARYFRNRNIGRLLLIIMVAILLHYVLMRVVTTNFAL